MFKATCIPRFLPIALLVVGGLRHSPAAVAENYHPLEIGSNWQYNSSVYGDEAMAITGERMILGVLTRIRREETDVQIFENFWTSDEEGNLYLHGGINYTFPAEVAYDPPILVAASPLSLGRTWTTEGVLRYDLDGNPYGGDAFDFPMRVYTEGIESVPAGEFYAYGVGYDTGPTPRITISGKQYDIFGRYLDSSGVSSEENAGEWYAVNIGPIIHNAPRNEDHAYHLVSYEIQVPVTMQTWGRMRYAFR